MSLINDALKKAQKQRTGDSPPLSAMPGVGGESAAKIAKRDKPAGFNAQLVRLSLAAGGLVVVLAVGGIFLFRSSNRPKNLRQAPGKGLDNQPASNPAESTAASSSLPADAKQSAGQTPGGQQPTTAPVTFKLPIAPPAAPVSSITSTAGGEAIPTSTLTGAPAERRTTPASPAAKRPDEPALAQRAPAVAPSRTAPNPGEGGSPPAPPAAVPVKLDSKSVNFIENLHIAGIRASATDSKVLMNDRVYRIGDIVEHDLGLKLTGITASSLTFEDERGARYTRSF